jgi:DNA-binding transcriptional ArsR family regulator
MEDNGGIKDRFIINIKGHMMTKNDNALKQITSQYENVATALYLVTNHLKDTEPLKNRVREISHDILEQMVHLSDISYVHVESHTSHLLSLLKIASSAGLIAEQNASILSQALQRTLKDMQDYMRSLTNMSISLSDLLYIEPATEVSESESETEIKNPSPENTSGPARVSAPLSEQGRPRPALAPNLASQHISASPKMSFNGVASMKRAFDTMNRGNQASGELSERQQSIIKELRNKGQLTVKDLAEKIRGCSEKTIQRELLSLVGSGVLKKEGERRWSRYSIK